MPVPNPILDWLTAPTPRVSWLIPDLLPQSYFVTLIAEAGAGKSTLSYMWAIALATGTPVLGRTPPAPRKVLYFDCENSLPDAMAYAQRAWRGLGRPSLELLEQNWLMQPYTLGNPGWPKEVTACIEAFQPALIVFDTALSCCPPLTAKGEDDNADAGRTIGKIRELCRLVSPSASALVLKHAKTFPVGVQEYDLRGAKAWKGAADSVLFLVKNPGKSKGVAKGHTSQLLPLKSRAFGLSMPIHITPVWLEDGIGLRLDVTKAED